MELIKVVEECHVSPPPGSVPNTSLPLTFFDILLLTVPPIQYLYFYESHHPDTDHFINHLLPNIKHSLSLTLQHFYPLAGYLTWPQESTKPEIIYEGGDYVSLTVAESAHNFYKLSDNSRREAIDTAPLIPKLTSTTKGKPLLALQVTFFPNQGICIGFTISHAASDGRSSNHFMKTWAKLCKSEPLTSDSYPLYDRSSLSYLRPKELAFLNHMVTKDNFHTLNPRHEDPMDKIWGTFVMSVSDIEKLKQFASSHFEKLQGVKPTFHFSSFVVTCAYIWSCYVKARCGEIETDVSEETLLEHLIVTVDARERLDPPLPLTYFGNCVYGVTVTIKRSELTGKRGVALAAILIRTSIKNLDLVAQTRKQGEMEKSMATYATFVPRHILFVGSSPKFGLYETDFGWGKLKRVEMSSIQSAQTISVTDCPDELGAMEIGVVRPKKEMDAFVHHFENSLNHLSSCSFHLLSKE